MSSSLLKSLEINSLKTNTLITNNLNHLQESNPLNTYKKFIEICKVGKYKYTSTMFENSTSGKENIETGILIIKHDNLKSKLTVNRIVITHPVLNTIIERTSTFYLDNNRFLYSSITNDLNSVILASRNGYVVEENNSINFYYDGYRTRTNKIYNNIKNTIEIIENGYKVNSYENDILIEETIITKS